MVDVWDCDKFRIPTGLEALSLSLLPAKAEGTGEKQVRTIKEKPANELVQMLLAVQQLQAARR